VAAALGRDLVLEVHAGDAARLVLAHGARDVQLVAVAGVGVGDQRDAMTERAMTRRCRPSRSGLSRPKSGSRARPRCRRRSCRRREARLLDQARADAVVGARKAALETDVEVIEVAQSVAPPDVAALLQLAPDEKAVHALRLRSIGGVPVMLTDAWVPARLGKRVSASALRKHALYEILMAQGVKFGRVVQEITAAVADPARARLLQVETGAPLLKMVRLLHDLDAQPVQHLTVSLTAERSRILMDIAGETINTLTAGQVVHDVHPPPSPPRRRG
jgi:DNA-binding GntR family transcriptional regulator